MKKSGLFLLIAFISNFLAWNYYGVFIFITFFCLFQIFKQVENYVLPKAFFIVFLFWLVYDFSATYWLVNADAFYGIMANIANALYLSFSYLIYRFVKPKFKFIAFICFYILLELNHLYSFLGCGWLNIGNCFGNQPYLIQWYKFTGLFGGTIWVLVVSYLFVNKHKRIGSLFLFIPIVFSLMQYFVFHEKPSYKNTIHVTIINPKYNIYNYNNKHRVFYLNNFLDEMGKDTLPRYVFLPETYIDEATIEEINTSIRQTQNIVIGGAELMQNSNKYNIFFVKKGKDIYVHKKEKYVPIIEYVPNWLSLVKKSEFQLKDYDDDMKIDSILPFSVLICYESIFNQIVKKRSNKKSTIFVLASEYFLKHSTIAYNQYNNILRVKAIEYNKQIVKVSFQGDNIIINSRGDIVKKFDDEEIVIDIDI